MFRIFLIILSLVVIFSVAVIVGDEIYGIENKAIVANISINSDADPCGNDIGNGNELIPGPSGPMGEDFDQVFRSLAVDPTDPNIVFVGTERNGIFKSIDGGATWQWLRCGIRHIIGGYAEVWDIAISPSGSSDAVFAATLDSPGPVTGNFPSTIGGVYKSTDGGLNWVRTNCGLESSRAVAISFDPNDADVLVLAIEGGEPSFSELAGQFFDGGLFKSTDKGVTWNPIDLPAGGNTNGYRHLYARGLNPTKFFTFGFNSKNLNENLGFLRSNDNGDNWNRFALDLEKLLMYHFDVSNDGETIYANERESFEIQKSTDGGESWTVIPAPQANGIIKVSPSDSNIVLFENIGNVFKSDDGLNSVSMALSGEERIGDIEFAPSDPNVVYAGASGYNIYKSTDAGSTFTLIANLRTDVMENEDTIIIPCATLMPDTTPTLTPIPTETLTPFPPFPTSTPTFKPEPTPLPTMTSVPTPTPPPPGKSFTFKCDKNLKTVHAGIKRLILESGKNEHCTIRLTHLEPGVQVEISSHLRKGLRSAIKIEPARSITDINGELEITITTLHKGIDWVAWSVANEKGEFEFSKRAYDAGLAWGMFVEVK